MKKIVVVGALWTSNFGDVLLARLFKEKLESLGCKVSFPNASKSVLEELNHREPNFTLKEADYLIFCGGGYFSEPPGNSFKWALSRYKLLFKYATQCRFFNIPYSILGVGAGPINSFLAKFMIKHVCKGAETIALRDNISVNTIKSLTNRNDIVLVADYVMKMAQPDKKDFRKNNKRLVGFHLTINGNNIINPAIRFLEAYSDNITPYFIEDHKGEFERVTEQYPKLKSIFKQNVYKYEGVDSFIEHISTLDVVITSKLHVGIVAATLNKSICSLPYHAKVERLYEELGRSELFYNQFCNSEGVFKHLVFALNSEPVHIPDAIINRSKNIDDTIEALLK